MTTTAAPPRRSTAETPARRVRKPRGDAPVAWLFLLPALIGFVAFYLVPTVRGFWISFTDWNLLSDPKFVGLDNYREMVQDAKFWNALRITAEYVVINIGSQTVLALAIAVLMDRLTKSVLVRAAIVVPWLVPNVTVAIVTLFMLDHNVGFVNHVLDMFGIEPQAFYGDSDQAIPTIALVNTWRNMGYTALLFFAGMQMIPRNLYEAAAIDGAGEWMLFRRITLPLLRPVMVLVLVVSIIGSFQIFDTVAVTTKGGPADATRVIYYYIYQKAFNEFHMGYAAAMAVALFLILILLTVTQMRMLRAADSDLR
ncbi:sugar ABC transporter permease [Streptosporangium subroseum]|uniref:carbohydrate ABC transporter permease n=1 Tax=Streptosporangium subroseum TaxID=106412 RepID=UPI00343F8925